MNDAERETWCLAWRLLVKHGSATADFIEAEIARALQQGNDEAAEHWRRLKAAAEQLAT